MKKVILSLLVAAFALSVSAQQDEDLQVLFGKNTKVRGFLGPAIELTSISGEFTGMLGFGGGVILDNIFLGGYGMGLSENTQLLETVDFGYGGLLIGYTFLSGRTIHPVISALVGMGSVKSPDYLFEEDHVYVLSPTIEMEINFTRFLRVSVGGTYRVVGGLSEEGAMQEGYKNNDFSGPAAIISFRFGWFE